jgi:translation initiation factor 2 subunit 3
MPRKKKTEEEKDATAEEKPKKAKKSSKKAKETSQPEISIGLVGHVDHGKTTLVKALSGKWTDTHSEELKRGITIRLGYADATFYKCSKCKGTDAYSVSEKCPKCGGKGKKLRSVSFVDAPGHESLMATMLCGSAIIDAALLIVAANEQCPQPQTKEHLMALGIIGIKNLIIIQNKIDLVSEKDAKKNYVQIKKFIAGTPFKGTPIIPISAQHSINVDILIEAIEKLFKTPKRDPNKDPLMFIARSFDINKPGLDISKLNGGVLGGALKQGKLSVGQEIEVLPGYEVEEKNKKVWKPITTKIEGLMAGGSPVEEMLPGGSMAVLTQLDPSITKSDTLAGGIVGEKGKLPPVWYDLELEIHLLERVVGAKDKLVVEPIKKGEILMLNVNAAATVGVVQELSKNIVKCALKRPVCAENESRVTISRRFGNRWRLIGFGIIK